MRAPWKILASLVSRKSAEAKPDPASDDKPKAIAYEEKIDVTEPAVDASAGNLDQAPPWTMPEQGDEIATEVGEAQAALSPVLLDSDTGSLGSDGQIGAGGEDEEVASVPAPDVSTAPVAKPSVKRPDEPERVATDDRVLPPTFEAEAQCLPVSKTILEQMSELDADIAELRQRLAEKLVVQNAQLRKLIERYDA